MAILDESETVRSETRRRRRRRRRRVVPSPSRKTVGYRTSDSGEAARTTRRRPARGADSAEAARLRLFDVLSRLELRRTSRDVGGPVVNRSELGEFLAGLRERREQSEGMRPLPRAERLDPSLRRREYDGGDLSAWSPEELEAAGFIDERTGTNFGLAARQVRDSVIYAPAGLYEAGKAVGLDTRDVASQAMADVGLPLKERGYTPSRSKDLAVLMAEQVAEDFRNPQENPGNLLLDLLALGSLGAGTTARVGAVGKAVRRGDTPGEVVRQAVRPDVPQRFLRHGDLVVEGSYSRSALGRYAQQVGDVLRDRDVLGGRVPVASGGVLRRSTASKAGWELGQNQRMLEAIERAPAYALQRKGKRLNAAEQTALRVVEEGRLIDERIAMHRAEIPGLKGRERAATVTQVGLLRKARKYVDESSGTPELGARASDRLRAAQELVRRNADRREEILLALERLSPEAVEARIQGPGRVVGGARWETGTARKRADRQLERTEAEVARQGRVVEGVRERVARSEERTRPLTLAEAEARIAAIERRWQALVDAKAAGMTPATRREINRRTKENRRLRRQGAEEKPTLTREMRAAAERELMAMLEASKHPTAVRFLEELAEARRLEEGLAAIRGRTDSLLPEEAVPAQRATSRVRRELLGTTQAGRNLGLEAILRHEERRQRNLTRRAEAARGRVDEQPPEGLFGEEGFSGGTTRIPYERGLPGLSLGAFVRGVGGSYGGLSRGRSLGYPRELATTRAPFTGRALLSGFFRSDTTNLVGEDLLRAQRFAAVLRARDALLAAAKDVPDDPLAAVAIRVDDLKNRSLPLAVREAIEAAEARELTKRHLREMQRDRGIEALQREAFPDMSWDEFARRQADGDPDIAGVKWVDADLLDASGLNAPPSLLASATRKASGARAALTVADLINDASRVAILYLKPAYLAPNVLGNLAMNVAQQGVFALVNLAKSARLSARLGDEGTAIVDSVMGEGFSAALRGEGQLARAMTNRLAEVWGKAVDVPFRRAAFLHEARRAGYRTTRQVRRLLTDESKRGELVQIARRANREIIDYSRLSPLERSVIRRVVFFYPWVKGATLYGARFPFEHPLQAAALGQLGAMGEEQAADDLGAVPGFARGSFKVGERDGLPLVINPRSISVLNTPIELAEAAVSFAQGDRAPGAQLVENLTPALGAATTALTGYDVFEERQVDPGLATFAAELTEGLPQVRLAERLGMDEDERERKLYPDTPTDAVLQFMAGGAAPRPYNPDVAAKIVEAEDREAVPFAERAFDDLTDDVSRARRLYRSVGERLPAEYRDLRQRRTLAAVAREDLQDDLDVEKLTEAQETIVLMQLAFQQIPEMNEFEDEWLLAFEEARGDPRDLDDSPAGQMHALRLKLQELLGFNMLDRYEEILNDLEERLQLQRVAVGG